MGIRTLVSLFTGAGGLDAGLESAGFRTVAANDFDADCVATLRAAQEMEIPVFGAARRRYLKSTRILSSPIESLSAHELRPRGASADWTPDLLAGGPPCQPFSSSGKMLSIHDPRGRLFEEFVRIASGLRPKYILFENVRGLVTARGPKGEPGEALNEVMEAFQEIGYATTFHLLNAADYGVPQRRVRLFMFGARISPLPAFPEPTHAPSDAVPLFGDLIRWRTLGELLDNRPEPPSDAVVRPSPVLSAKLAGLPEGSGLKSAGAREATRPGGHWGYKQGTFIADRSKPARTITAATTQDWIRLEDGSVRRLTEEECATIQGFPDRWPFQGNAASRFRQIGNAVPFVLGRVLGQSVIAALTEATDSAPRSAPLPESFHIAINYTKREQSRNGNSRAMVRSLRRSGQQTHSVKGLGAADLLGSDGEEQLLLEDLWASG